MIEARYINLLGFKVIFVIVYGLFFGCTLYTKSACIIVHGTWATQEAWYRKGGDFFQAVVACNDEIRAVDEVTSFSWSGKLGDLAQLEAAQNLAKVIVQYDSVIIIAHSHGATIGMMAADIISKENSASNKMCKIEKFYALGAPLKESWLVPHPSIIKKFYNLFSFGDFIQPVGGAYDRAFGSKFDHVVHISVQLNDLHPDHSQLHHPAIGMWLLKIEDYFAACSIGNFDQFSFAQPGCIIFETYKYPTYLVQDNQSTLLVQDKKAQEMLQLAFFRGGRG